jgi:hypothetical protein
LYLFQWTVSVDRKWREGRVLFFEEMVVVDLLGAEVVTGPMVILALGGHSMVALVVEDTTSDWMARKSMARKRMARKRMVRKRMVRKRMVSHRLIPLRIF